MKMQFCRIALSGILATGLALCCAPTFAQDEAPPPAAQGPGGGMGRRGMMSPDAQLARMTTRYELSADQQAQIKPILEDQQKQMQALRQDSSMSREDRRAKMESIRSDSNTKIEAVLNDQQKQKFAQDEQRMQERRGGGGPQ